MWTQADDVQNHFHQEHQWCSSVFLCAQAKFLQTKCKAIILQGTHMKIYVYIYIYTYIYMQAVQCVWKMQLLPVVCEQ